MSVDPAPSLTAADVAGWRSAIGRERVQREVIDAGVLARFAVAVGAQNVANPPLGHWAFFLDVAERDLLGGDGHVIRGDFIPAITLPRRMFASATVEFKRPLEPGLPAECVTRVESIEHKVGQSGELVFVLLSRRVGQAGRVCVQEQQTIVYRNAGTPTAPIVPRLLETAGETWMPGPVDLFRFSAVTFNAHRIHYDLDYARNSEGYPDLVVHGPFVAVKLFQYARRRLGRDIRSFSFRAQAPIFVSQPIHLTADAAPTSFAAIRCDGTRAITARFEFA